MKVHKIWNGISGFLTACCCLVSGSGLSAVAEDAATVLTAKEPIVSEIISEETSSIEEIESFTTTTAPITTETTIEIIETISEDLDDETIALGDLNGDGAVSVEDAVFVLTIYAKQSAGLEVDLSSQQFFCLDCDHDAKISVEDAILILEYYAKHAACLVTGTFSEYVDEKQNPVTTTITELTTLSETSTEITTETTTKTTLPTTDTTEDTTQDTTTVVSLSDFSDSYAGSYIVTVSALNLRRDPSTTSSVIIVIPNNAIVTVTMGNGEWAAVTYEGKNGYCSMDYLILVPDTTTVPEEATTTTTETTTTTTTTMPNSVNLPVNCILQNASPSLPTGCEATALTIALNYDGFTAEKTNIAKIYLPKMVFYTLNNIYYGADFQYVFPGDPTTSYGYGCYAPAIVATANAYFTAQKNASYAENISGTSFYDLFPYLAAGRPIVFWGTMNMCAPGTGGSWTTPDGETVTWKSNEHCLVLTGYNKSAGTVQVADPLRGNVSYDMELVAQRYTQMGKQAVVLHSTSQLKTETLGVTNNGVYCLRNAGSGLYLTVADGMDVDGTNLIQDTANGTSSQKFRISYDTSSNTYRLYAMCSSNGTNRVVDIVKLGGGIASGCNVEIYQPVDAPAQTFVLSPQSDGTMLLSCSANRSACLSVWNQATGSNYDTGFYASGNVVIRNDIGDDLQHWILEPVS